MTTAHFALQPGLELAIALKLKYFLCLCGKRLKNHNQGGYHNVLIMTRHAMLKTWPSGLSRDKKMAYGLGFGLPESLGLCY